MWSFAIIPTLTFPSSIVEYKPLYWKYTGFTLSIVSKPLLKGVIFFLVRISEVLIQAVPVLFAASPVTYSSYTGVVVPIPTNPFESIVILVVDEPEDAFVMNYILPASLFLI